MAPLSDENFPTAHCLQEPAAVALCPTRPEPGPHTVCSPHALMSDALLNWLSAALHTSHCRSDVLLPVPATRPSPGGQFRHSWHSAAPSDAAKWSAAHAKHVGRLWYDDVAEPVSAVQGLFPAAPPLT